jgi:hypothetical protein
MAARIDSDDSQRPVSGAKAHTPVIVDDDLAEKDKDVYTSGIKLRDLGDIGNYQFPGLKRERWW